MACQSHAKNIEISLKLIKVQITRCLAENPQFYNVISYLNRFRTSKSLKLLLIHSNNQSLVMSIQKN